MTRSIPFLDLVTPHAELEQELLEIARTSLQTAGFIGGKMLQDFETHFAEYIGARECIGVASGTDALLFALIAGGVQPGDTILTVANTFIATAEAITQAGATPEFVEIDERTYNMSPAHLRAYLESCAVDSRGRRLGKRTKTPISALLPVHLYGQMADMDALSAIAEEFGLMLFEDACQAHGAKYYSANRGQWITAGSTGLAAAFSFYPGKNLGACGEAGAVTTNDSELAARIRMLRDHGQASKYYHDVIGYNGRLDAMQAGFLDVKLRHLSKWTEQRQSAAAVYDRLLADVSNVVRPFVPANSKPVYHLYAIRIENRNHVQKQLAEAGIGTGIHYPVPVHLQKAYQGLGYKAGDLRITEQSSTEILSLPMYPHITLEDQKFIAHSLAQATSTETAKLKVSAG